MFAGQQPYRTWPQALPPPDDPGPGARGTESVSAKLNGVSSGAGRSHWLLIVIGLVAVALASVGFLGTVMLRPRVGAGNGCRPAAAGFGGPFFGGGRFEFPPPDDRARAAFGPRTGADPNRCFP